MDIIHSPKNTVARIDRVWMFVSVDEGGEGIVAAPIGGLGAVPLIAADEARLKSLRPLAQDLAKVLGRRIRLIRLSVREEIEEYGA